MIELENFYNDGFGWHCRRCEREIKLPAGSGRHSRLFREGEAEGKAPRLSSVALARWADASRTTLECPRCGAAEQVGKA